MKNFHVALTGDFHDADGELKFRDIGLSVFADEPQVRVRRFEEHRSEIGADQLAGVQGVVVLTPSVTRESIANASELIGIARFGVGYDSVDIAACTAADVLVCTTPGAVDRSVAEAMVGWMIALSHRMTAKDRLVREAKWDERSRLMGCELRDRTLGVIGLGGIARKVLELLSGWGMNPPLAYDPHINPAAAATLGVRLVGLGELLSASDFVSIHCPLTPETRGLIGRSEIERMKPEAYLINTARGGIVDEDALYDALKQGRLAGAALDCFLNEPLLEPSRFCEFENVLHAPHAIAWTHEMFREIGRAACQVMVDLSRRRRPRGMINPQVLESRGFQRKWERVSDEKL